MQNVMDAARVVYEAAAREEAIITVGEGLAEDRVATVSRLLNGYASFPLGLDIINAITTGSSLSSCYTILHGAAKSGDAPLVHTLLARGAWKVWNLEMLVPSPLVLAIRGGHEEIVELLMSPEVLKKHPHPSPMYTAAFYGHLGIVRRLIQTAKESDAIGASDIVNSRSLWVAIRNGHTEVALELAQIPEVYQAYLKSELSLVVAANNGGSIDCLYIVKVSKHITVWLTPHLSDV
jgi:ankyrin repeat protein